MTVLYLKLIRKKDLQILLRLEDGIAPNLQMNDFAEASNYVSRKNKVTAEVFLEFPAVDYAL